MTVSRRDALKLGAAAGAVAALATPSLAHPAVFPGGSDELRVGLIGCGGRGVGAAENACNAGPNIKLVAIADVFQDRIDQRLAHLKRGLGDKFAVAGDHIFSGFDAYEKLLKTDCNYVILATPPGFRPMHLQACIQAGKNVFTEKPVAVDGAGIRLCLDLAKEAKARGLGVVAGTQRRHQTGYLRALERIRAGAIGDIVAARCYWNQGHLWHVDRTEKMTDMEWQLRNWLYFVWLSGDHIVEQHVHNIDVVNWFVGAHPSRAVALGGRQTRVEPHYGHIFDHFAVDFEYPSGMHCMSMCRQINGTEGNVSEVLVGTKGTARLSGVSRQYAIKGESEWTLPRREDNDPYLEEHVDLVKSIRSGQPLNELQAVAEATLSAIMGRMAAYTGKAVTWEQALNSKENWMPDKLAFGSVPVPPVAMPGKTELI
ncbi:MAG TPA: Gfo/Idh/MocA family oxidoreductase [Gemmatales bacterium]|nr:Gfo/Idh/MocA family oxidoreductase [Gemmatales bacterium]HMP61179.1 Gfo/Idh/MocA family oxidoreductase [Gemmatales bacterium]